MFAWKLLESGKLFNAQSSFSVKMFNAQSKIGGPTFEVGGRNKTAEQVQGVERAYLAKDGIEAAFSNTIPLWCFGLNY